MLDAGFEKWKSSGYPIEMKSSFQSYSKFDGKANSRILTTAREIKRSLGNKNLVMVDACPAEEFDGFDVRAIRRGHIPSAVNMDWENNIENGTLKDIEKLSKIYLSIPKDSTVVTYCPGGYGAANAFVTLKAL